MLTLIVPFFFFFARKSKLLLQLEPKPLNPVMTSLTGITFALVRDSLSISLSFSVPQYWILSDQCKLTVQQKVCNFTQLPHDPGNTCIRLSALGSKFNPKIIWNLNKYSTSQVLSMRTSETFQDVKLYIYISVSSCNFFLAAMLIYWGFFSSFPPFVE